LAQTPSTRSNHACIAANVATASPPVERVDGKPVHPTRDADVANNKKRSNHACIAADVATASPLVERVDGIDAVVTHATGCGRPPYRNAHKNKKPRQTGAFSFGLGRSLLLLI